MHDGHTHAHRHTQRTVWFPLNEIFAREGGHDMAIGAFTFHERIMLFGSGAGERLSDGLCETLFLLKSHTVDINHTNANVLGTNV
jgi:hypothetical protein